nr:type I pullulanase [uncultured Ruminococcus sp.]
MVFSLTATCFYADEEAAQEAAEEETEVPTEETQAPTQPPPTEPPKPDPKKLGYAKYAAKLDETVYRDSDLGATYTEDHTTFKLWAPTADDVKVCIYKTGSDKEEGFNNIVVKPMTLSKSVGTWYVTLEGDLKNMYYTYKVTIGSVTHEVVDPYAKAVGVNGDRGMIVDLNDTDPEGWSDDSFKRVSEASDAIVWEVSVRDFSAAENSGVSEKNRGKFLAFTEKDTKLNGQEGGVSTCVSYLKELGVNYVQINPFYDFASIDEAESIDDQYNWGYDPKNYNAPEGSYSSDPYDGRVRIQECKQMIQALHEAGIGVIMDVVYNHTYESEDSFFNQIAPYYYYRINEDGTWSNGSACGNDVATERTMARKFIRESVAYWADEYHIDGFRFDLMGLMDVETMNGIRKDLDALSDGEHIIMYGEAWNMKTNVPSNVTLANQDNMDQLSERIGAFNDSGRDAIKGSNFEASGKGFVQEGSSKGGVRDAIEGVGKGWASVPSQCVNYASCHDNLTLYDKLTSSVYDDGKYTQRREDLLKMNQLSAAAVLMSRGVPFMLAGEELGRTKQGDENSYRSSVEVNQIDWFSRYRFTSMTDYYKGLISIRKAIPTLRDGLGERTTIDYLDSTSKNTIAYSVTGSDMPSVVVALNGDNTKAATVSLPDGKWIVLADDQRAGLKSLGEASGTVNVPATSAYVLVDAGSFAAIEQEAPECLLYIRYKDKANDGAVVCEERLTGNMNETYVAATPSEILFNYNITSDSALNGTFTKAFQIIDVSCTAYKGEYSTVTIKFLNPDSKVLANTVVMTNRVGQQYYTPTIPGIKGYALDLDNLPANGAGLYTKEPIEVVYYYKEAEKIETKDEYTCPANVIYLADDGTILSQKSYRGVEGDKLEIEDMEFDGYKYYDISNENAVFSENELNVLVYYQNPQRAFWLTVKNNLVTIILVFVGIAALIVIAVILIRRVTKKNKMMSIKIDD